MRLANAENRGLSAVSEACARVRFRAPKNTKTPSCELTSPPDGLSFGLLPRWIREGKREFNKESCHSSNRSLRHRAPCASQSARRVQRGRNPPPHLRLRPNLPILHHPAPPNSR